MVTKLVKQQPAFLWNLKVHYRSHNSPPLEPIMSNINLVHILIFYIVIILLSRLHLIFLCDHCFPAVPTKVTQVSHLSHAVLCVTSIPFPLI
jgi:hypothetical protein